MTDELQGFPVTIEHPVRWGDMDAFAHVNNTVYFRYFEHVRIACFERIGFIDTMHGSGIGPILARTSCAFRVPLEYPDTVTVGTRITDVGEDRFTMLYRVWSHRKQVIAAEGDGRMVVFDYRAGQKAPLPPAVRAAIEAL